MAIAEMKKLSVVALKNDEDKLVETLMGMGIAQIENIDPESMDGGLGSILTKRDNAEALGEYDARLKIVREAIDILAPYSKAKKVMFAPKKRISKKLFDEIAENVTGELEFARRVCDMTRRGSEIKAEQNRLQNEIDALRYWERLPFAPDFAGTRHTSIILGSLPVGQSAQMLNERFLAEDIAAQCESLSEDGGGCVYVICHKAYEQEAMLVLTSAGFGTAAVHGDEIPTKTISKLEKQIAALEEEKLEAANTLCAMAENKLRLETLYDYISECMEKERAYEKLAGTQYTVMLSGWVPADAADSVLSVLEKKYDCIAEAVSPTDDEDYPILLRNPRIVQPVESVTEMYSLPAPHSMDPNKLMAPFFFLLFGMMVSDAGYGLVLTLATAFILKKYKPQGQAEKLIRLICYGGVATMLWGVIFGGYFGDTIQVAYQMITGQTLTIPYLLSPSDDPISVLVLSLIIGLIHLFAGMGAKAYLLIKRGQIWDAVFDIGFWYLVLGGLAVMCLGMVLPTTPVMQIGIWIAVCGAVGLICTQGREKKNFFGKLIGGIGSLYDIVSYLSDLLSYSRLLALGLSTGVVASVVNTMGSMGGNSVVGWILFVLVFLVGHTFNLAINTLGAYVHSSRLQYVEFFGKFYESGGKPFKPFGRPRKYVEVTDDGTN